MARRFTTPIVLPGAPTNTDEAATKGYVDTGLGGKAASSHAHAAADVTSGTLDVARVPTGTSGTTVALGNHTHNATDVGAVPTSRTITAGTALTGGGDLTANRTLAVDLGTGSSQAAAGNHTHAHPNVPQAWQSLSSSSTLTMDCDLGTRFRCSALATNTTVADPTDKADGQQLLLVVVASAATRTVDLNGSIVNMTGDTFPVSVPSGKRWVGGFLIEGSTALLIASKVQP